MIRKPEDLPFGKNDRDLRAKRSTSYKDEKRHPRARQGSGIFLFESGR